MSINIPPHHYHRLPAVQPKTYQEWCVARNVHHAHCPMHCEHPQPFMRKGLLICGRCWFMFGRWSLMIPCFPHHCE